MTNLGTEPALEAEEGDMYVELIRKLTERYSGQRLPRDCARLLDFCRLSIEKRDSKTPKKRKSTTTAVDEEYLEKKNKFEQASSVYKNCRKDFREVELSKKKKKQFEQIQTSYSQLQKRVERFKKFSEKNKIDIDEDIINLDQTINGAKEPVGGKGSEQLKNKQNPAKVNKQKSVEEVDKKLSDLKERKKKIEIEINNLTSSTSQTNIIEQQENLKLQNMQFNINMERMRTLEDDKEKRIKQILNKIKVVENQKKRAIIRLNKKLATARSKLKEVRKDLYATVAHKEEQIKNFQAIITIEKDKMIKNIERSKKELDNEKKEFDNKMLILASEEEQEVREIQAEKDNLKQIINNKKLKNSQLIKSKQFSLAEFKERYEESIHNINNALAVEVKRIDDEIKKIECRETQALREKENKIKELNDRLDEAKIEATQNIERSKQEVAEMEKEITKKIEEAKEQEKETNKKIEKKFQDLENAHQDIIRRIEQTEQKAENISIEKMQEMKQIETDQFTESKRKIQDLKDNLAIAQTEHKIKINLMKQDAAKQEQQIKAEIERLKDEEEQLRADISAKINNLNDQFARDLNEIKKNEQRSIKLLTERETIIKETIASLSKRQEEKRKQSEENINKLEIKLIKVRSGVDENCELMKQRESECKKQLETEMKRQIERSQEVENTVEPLEEEFIAEHQ